MQIDKDILKARKIWNAAAHASREVSPEDAADTLYVAALAVAGILAEYIQITVDDEESEAGWGRARSGVSLDYDEA